MLTSKAHLRPVCQISEGGDAVLCDEVAMTEHGQMDAPIWNTRLPALVWVIGGFMIAAWRGLQASEPGEN